MATVRTPRASPGQSMTAAASAAPTARPTRKAGTVRIIVCPKAKASAARFSAAPGAVNRKARTSPGRLAKKALRPGRSIPPATGPAHPEAGPAPRSTPAAAAPQTAGPGSATAARQACGPGPQARGRPPATAPKPRSRRPRSRAGRGRAWRAVDHRGGGVVRRRQADQRLARHHRRLDRRVRSAGVEAHVQARLGPVAPRLGNVAAAELRRMQSGELDRDLGRGKGGAGGKAKGGGAGGQQATAGHADHARGLLRHAGSAGLQSFAAPRQ